jgi:hypothetical protein
MVEMKSRQQREHASQLTQAVVCAENIAEVTSGTKDIHEAADMIGKIEGSGEAVIKGNEIVTAVSSGSGHEDEYDGADTWEFDVTVRVGKKKGQTGVLLTKDISVFLKGKADPLYELDAAGYAKEKK